MHLQDIAATPDRVRLYANALELAVVSTKLRGGEDDVAIPVPGWSCNGEPWQLSPVHCANVGTYTVTRDTGSVAFTLSFCEPTIQVMAAAMVAFDLAHPTVAIDADARWDLADEQPRRRLRAA